MFLFDRKRPLGRQRSRWEDNIKMDLKEIGWEGMDWMHLEFLDYPIECKLLEKDSAPWR